MRDKADRFVQVRVLGIDDAYERLRRIGAPDPIGAIGLLTSLLMTRSGASTAEAS